MPRLTKSAVLGLLLSAAGAYYGKLSNDSAWKIAALSGSFDKPEFVVGVGRVPLDSNGKLLPIYVGSNETATKDRLVFGAIPFSVLPGDKKSLEDLTLTFQYDKRLRSDLLEQLQLTAFGNFGAQDIKRSFTASGNSAFVSYRVPHLAPREVLSIQEPIVLSETMVSGDAPVTTKDGVHLVVPFSVWFSFSFGISTSAKDVPVNLHRVDVSVEKASSMEDLMFNGRLVENAAEERLKLRKSLNFLQYFVALCREWPKAKAILVYVPLKSVSEGSATVYVPDGSQQVRAAEYSLLDWALLFPQKQKQ